MYFLGVGYTTGFGRGRAAFLLVFLLAVLPRAFYNLVRGFVRDTDLLEGIVDVGNG